jgi:hypothetical protein
MSNSIELEFLDDDAEENEGLGDAGIETYRDAIYAGVARESAQNSADARKARPVKMSFDVLEVDIDDIPSIEKFTNTVNICLSQAKKEKNEKAIDFFKHAKNILKSGTIHVLHVADYNTKGLVGPCVRGTPFHSLVKGSGISVKESETSGGSFGIGKNAAFAVSELQTVFYSSQYLEKGKLQFIAQGKSLLVSHEDENGDAKKGKGYWGLKNYKAITDISKVPKWLRRKEQGTSIFSMGFRQLDNWQYKMAASLISNFFYAIHRGDMEFSVNNKKIEINKKALPALFGNSAISKAAEENNSEEGFEFAKDLFKCLVSSHTKEYIFNINLLGNVSFKILVAEGLPKRLAFIRNGMIITDNLDHFGDKFAKFRMSKDFIAIVEAQEDSGNAFIKKLENPRHDGLSAERIPDPVKSQEANDAMKELIKKIREIIRQETVSTPDNEITVDELTEFFADDSNRNNPEHPGQQENLETFVYTASVRQVKQPGSALAGGKGNKGTKGRPADLIGKNDKDVNGDGKRNENGKAGNESQDNSSGKAGQITGVNIRDVRNILVKTGRKVYRRIFFTSPLTCETQITIQATGINNNEELTLVSANSATIKDNKVLLKVSEGKKTSFDVEFAEDYQGPVEVFANTIIDKSNEN